MANMLEGELDPEMAAQFEAFAAGQRSAFAQGKPRASIPGATYAVAALSWIAFVAAVCLFAWPLGLSMHAAWAIFLSGWHVIG